MRNKSDKCDQFSSTDSSDFASIRSTSELICELYDKLKAIAESMFLKERLEHTLQATALINETYLRMKSGVQYQQKWETTEAFVSAAANTMRQILINHARDKKTIKRGRNWSRQPLDVLSVPTKEIHQQLIELNELFEELENSFPRACVVAGLRVFAGLSIAEIASVMGLNSRTIDRDWQFARSWLVTKLK